MKTKKKIYMIMLVSKTYGVDEGEACKLNLRVLSVRERDYLPSDG